MRNLNKCCKAFPDDCAEEPLWNLRKRSALESPYDLLCTQLQFESQQCKVAHHSARAIAHSDSLLELKCTDQIFTQMFLPKSISFATRSRVYSLTSSKHTLKLHRETRDSRQIKLEVAHVANAIVNDLLQWPLIQGYAESPCRWLSSHRNAHHSHHKHD